MMSGIFLTWSLVSTGWEIINWGVSWRKSLIFPSPHSATLASRMDRWTDGQAQQEFTILPSVHPFYLPVICQMTTCKQEEWKRPLSTHFTLFISVIAYCTGHSGLFGAITEGETSALVQIQLRGMTLPFLYLFPPVFYVMLATVIYLSPIEQWFSFLWKSQIYLVSFVLVILYRNMWIATAMKTIFGTQMKLK